MLNKSYRMICSFIFTVLVLINITAWAGEPNYADEANWAYFGESRSKAVDVFFIAPTVELGSPTVMALDMNNEAIKSSFVGATNMEKGLYDRTGNFYAPFYRQASLLAYNVDGRLNSAGYRPSAEESRKLFATAYEDVRKAFAYYWTTENKGKPVIIAGFSQGAQHAVRLLTDYVDNEKFRKQHIATYAIGWRVTDADLAQLGSIKMAAKADDVGVIVSFNSEAEGVSDSLMVPANAKTYGINPLNWRTDNLPASLVLNKGACFTDYAGAITAEKPWLCGAYLDKERGTLKITGIEQGDYPALLPGFAEGVYHIYDYMFFYRNLQENVEQRAEAYFNYLVK